MIFAHNDDTLKEDLIAFNEIVNRRQRIIDSVKQQAVPASYNINEQAKRLHPTSQRMRMISKWPFLDGDFIVTLCSCNNEAAWFRAGQYVNISVDGIDCFRPYFLVSSPEDTAKGIYSVHICNKTGDDISKYISDSPVGIELNVSEPMGFLYFQPLRDSLDVTFYADETGIGAAMSLSDSISLGSEEANLSVYFIGNAVSPVKNCVNYLSVDDVATCFHSGSVFVCGTGAFCESMLAKLSSDKKIRFCITDSPTRSLKDILTYQCTVISATEEYHILCQSNETLLTAFEKNKIKSKAKCRSGECGYCRCKLVSGKVDMASSPYPDSRRIADIKYGIMHPCCTFPSSDLTVSF